MKDELFVVLMLRSSERARLAVGRALGHASYSQLPSHMTNADAPKHLASVLRCPPDQVFIRLAQHIRTAFKQHGSMRLTYNHLHKFVTDIWTSAQIAFTMGVLESQIFDLLFRAEALRSTMLKIDSGYLFAADTRSLLSDLLTSRRRRQIELRITGGEDDWGTIIDTEGWLRSEASHALMSLAHQQELAVQTPAQVLAVLIESGPGQSSQGTAPQLDSLALVYLRRRMTMIIDWLRDEALEHAQESAALYPAQRALRRLPTAIEVYERGAIRRALSSMVTPQVPLAEYLRPANCDIPALVGDLDLKKTLLITAAQQYKKNVVQRQAPFVVQRQLVSFEIHCFLKNQSDSQLALRAHDVPLTLYSGLRSEIMRLKGSDLATVGATTGERILNTSIPIPERLRQYLRLGFEQLAAQVAPVMVMSGTALDQLMDIPWKEEFEPQSPYAPFHTEQKLHFPIETHTMINTIIQDYMTRGKALDIVRGDTKFE